MVAKLGQRLRGCDADASRDTVTDLAAESGTT